MAKERTESSKLEIYIDGASKGNPGPAGIGVVICRTGKTIKNISQYIGEASNNFAEYTALIYGLQEALILKAIYVLVKTDSQLLAKQIKGEYKIKNATLKSLYSQANHLLRGFKNYDIIQIPREENKGADKLASLAIKSEAAKLKLGHKGTKNIKINLPKPLDKKGQYQLELF